nr:MAG TPA: hypothetical protein [Caudoviricetes sp.]DAN19735.1 MAG TPA: hypothetical protein [Caudoviricetes sp.]
MCTLTRIFVYSRYNAESGLINKKTPTGNVSHTSKCSGSIDVWYTVHIGFSPMKDYRV